MPVLRNSQTRTWFIENRAAPSRTPKYKGRFRFGDWSQSYGDTTRVEEPSDSSYDRFTVVDLLPGEVESATFDIQGRYQYQDDFLFQLADRNCEFDVQAHLGRCVNPQDYDNNWDEIIIFEQARITSYSVENFGALQSGDRDVANETVEVSAERIHRIVKIDIGDVAPATDSLSSVAVYGRRECTVCDEELGVTGCETIVAGSATANNLYFTDDGWGTSGSTVVTTAAGAITAVGVAGLNVVAGSGTSVHVADISDIVIAAESWASISVGNTVSAITVQSPAAVWIGDAAGNISKLNQLTIESTLPVFTALQVNAIDYSDVAGSDATLLAVGASNSVAYSTDGGGTWISIVGPAVGVALLAAKALTPRIWLVGDANGDLWYTSNRGAAWTEITLSGSPTAITDIAFVSPSVGYLLADGASGSFIYRTTNGGNSWKLLPDNATALPTHTSLSDLAVCGNHANLFYAVGDNGGVGSIIKGGS